MIWFDAEQQLVCVVYDFSELVFRAYREQHGLSSASTTMEVHVGEYFGWLKEKQLFTQEDWRRWQAAFRVRTLILTEDLYRVRRIDVVRLERHVRIMVEQLLNQREKWAVESQERTERPSE